MILGSRVRTCLVKGFENLDFVRNLLFPFLKNSSLSLMTRDWQMQFYIKSKPISVGVSINGRLNYITYIIGKGIKYPSLSPFHGLWQLYFNRGLQSQKTATCTILQKIINRFLCLLIVFLESKTHQLNFEGRD